MQPALHLIAVVAQGDKGRDGKYRLRMDSTMIEKVYGWAKRKNAILFVDVQVGHSTLQSELPWLERFLMRPDVHLGHRSGVFDERHAACAWQENRNV